MKTINTLYKRLAFILALFSSLSWIQVHGCEITQDNNGRYIFRNCYLHKEQLKIKMIECLVYENNINNLSELLNVRHFHINNDLGLPAINHSHHV